MFFRCDFFEASNHIFCKQCEKVTPKGTQKDNPNHQIHGCTTSQNIWYLQYGSHILQFWMCFGIHFFHTVLRTLFFHHFFAFWEIRCQNSPKNGRVFYAENLTNSALSPKSSHEAPRRAQGLPNDAKMLPKGPKMMPPGPLKLKLYTHSHATQSRNEQTHNSRLLARWRLIAQRIG